MLLFPGVGLGFPITEGAGYETIFLPCKEPAYSPKPPIILGYDAGTPLQVGDMQRFNCVATGGNPPAMLSWFKGDREVDF
ncbi:ig-like domain-containing protein [Trichonephila clavata]|uniref:Ig-like domain-containing protein n=1 Tax=Trichonephila clavata TaxID=2740835 RepID=A0A8X6M1Q2_TRICU|nr:ig-like domain-containing protein [Trichonephila clavata]